MEIKEDEEKKRLIIFTSVVITWFVVMKLGTEIANSLVKELSTTEITSSTTIHFKEAVLLLWLNGFISLLGEVLGGFGLLKRCLFFMSFKFENERFSVLSVIFLFLLTLYSMNSTISTFNQYQNLIMKDVPKLFLWCIRI